MADIDAPTVTFASGRYSKRKRTQVTYHLDELDVSDSEPDFDAPQAKKRTVNTTSRPLPKHKIFPFLQLPAEIRNTIYEYALTDPSGINLVGVFKHKRRTVERISAPCEADMMKEAPFSASFRMKNSIRNQHEEPVSLVPSLLAVNKQIHQEAIDILYGRNEFILTDGFALYSFIINLGPSGAKQLKTLRIRGWLVGRGLKAYNHCCFAVLAWATNLTAFYLDCQVGQYRDITFGADQIYRDAFPWLEAVGRAQGRFDAALDIIKLDETYFMNYCMNYRGSYHDPSYLTSERFKKSLEGFQAVLRTALGAHQKRILARPSSKRTKVAKKVVTVEQ